MAGPARGVHRARLAGHDAYAPRVRGGGPDIAAAGVDDPHIDRDRYDTIAGPASPAANLRLGLTHSPYPRVLDRFAADGYQLVLAGHTHGGQLCLPFYGALVTNCDLDPSRAKGTSRWGATHAAARVGRHRHVAVRAVPVLLPARSHAADAGRRPDRRPRLVTPVAAGASDSRAR